MSFNIDSLRNKLFDICGNEKIRKKYIVHAHRARIDFFVREWDELLGQDIDQLESYFEFRQSAAAEEESKRIGELKKDYKEKIEQVKGSLSEIMCKVDERSYWTNALEETKNTTGWEKQYVRLSTDIMKQSLQNIYQEVRTVTVEHFASHEYPECYPLPTLADEDVWDKMTWGDNCMVDNRAGMWGGAAAGAAAGSVIPGVGTLLGAVIGFSADLVRDSSKDEKERQEFKSNCINRTVTAFYKEPATYAKREIRDYMDELFRRMEKDLWQKCTKIKDELVERTMADNEYQELSLLLNELRKYRKVIRSYSETAT